MYTLTATTVCFLQQSTLTTDVRDPSSLAAASVGELDEIKNASAYTNIHLIYACLYMYIYVYMYIYIYMQKLYHFIFHLVNT